MSSGNSIFQERWGCVDKRRDSSSCNPRVHYGVIVFISQSEVKHAVYSASGSLMRLVDRAMGIMNGLAAQLLVACSLLYYFLAMRFYETVPSEDGNCGYGYDHPEVNLPE